MQKTDDPSAGQDKSIRKRLTRTVLIPSITLLVLWIAVSSYFVFNGLYAKVVADSVRQVSIPALSALAAIQQERQVGVEFLVNNGVSQADLADRQKLTDERLRELQTVFGPAIDSAPAQIADRMRELKSGFDQLPVIRAQIGFKSVSKAQANDFYNGILDTAFRLFEVQARVVPDEVAVQGAIAAITVFRSTDNMSREASLITSGYASGTLTPDEFMLFTQLMGVYRADLSRNAQFLEPSSQALYQNLIASDSWKRLAAAEDALVKRGPWTPKDKAGLPVGQTDWQKVSNDVAAAMTTLTIDQADKVSAAAIASGESQLRNAIIGSVIALLVSVASVIIAVRVSRTLVDRTLMTRLERLRNDSLDLAGNRLPDIVDRLKSGQQVDVAAELPRLDHGKDEIGQVAEALNIAQLTAVSAAVSEAKARSGVHNVFLGIAHRNQVLVHRQLQILDEMEKREEDSAQLASLFQLDHLATRARRTTENLIILGGKQPGRRWRNPVPLMEVLRAAVSETEQYSRVRVEAIPEVSITGSAVADTIHLVAELVDNGTTYSPPGSQVEVTATLVARGVVIEVSDQGLGMTETVRDWANAMMAETPEFDAMALRADTSLGLFVVARIASRLGITVTFAPSRYGGTRATVLIPTQVLVADGQTEDRIVVSDPQPPIEWPEPRAAIHSSGVLARAEEKPEKPRPKPRPAPDETPQGERAPLPQRRPQQNLVTQLRDDPDDDHGDDDVESGNAREFDQSRTLSAFHKGTLRGRESDMSAD
ncbi:signal transduction histidine kinase [Kibdelosporangium banguiense]|uniref:histidine kinase n=1 Tax=Kibdelosporangium banguiense TaxID=1365924 RepID=A0ABS4U0F0_9PSEU|nr:nitrate- and nitrite sensing domain-containing protein [Kibdelosporangium banguiense]MBP2330134.1 signal transduction histidine kinase [Kibdelosporangium banguiense]